MVRRIREEFQVGKRIPSSDTIVLTYPAASLDKSKARLMMRRRESDQRVEIPREQWDFVDARRVRLLPEGTLPTPLTIYEFWYEATNSRVDRHRLRGGARSDLVPAAFAELAAGCEQAAPRHRLRHLAERTLPAPLPRPAHEPRPRRPPRLRRRACAHRRRRQDVHQSFVRRAEPHDVAARGSSLSGGLVSVLGGDHAPIRSAARPASLLAGDGTDPLLIQSNTSAEYWEKGASLLTIDALGKADLAMPETTRAYLIAGTQHAGALPTAPRGPNANAVNWQSPLPAVRALLTAMEDWVVRGIAPPAEPRAHDQGRHRRRCVDDPLSAAPDFALARVSGKIRTTPVDWVDPPGSPDSEHGQAGGHLRHAGVRRRCGRQRGRRHPPAAGGGAACDLHRLERVSRSARMSWPTATARSCRSRGQRPSARRAATSRRSLAERYRSLDDYVAQVQACVDKLVAERLLLPADAEAYVAAAKASDAFRPASLPSAAAK